MDWVPAPAACGSPPGPPSPEATAAVHFFINRDLLTQLLGTEPGRVFGDHTIWLQATDSNGKPGPAIGAVFTLAMRNPVISTLAINPPVTNGSTVSNQMPVAATKISAPSDNRPVPQKTLNVYSTAGFPANCATGGCLITVGMTVADGPAQGDIEYGTFTYTHLTPTSFTGVQAAAPIAANTYVFNTGNTVALDVVPAGYIAVNATATASLPGWVIQGSQACVLYATTGPVPGPAGQVETRCNTSSKKIVTTLGLTGTNLAPDGTAPLAAVSGFLPPPTLPDGVSNAGRFWVMVRAQEGPNGTPCASSPTACRWSPWLYYNPVSTTTTTTRALAQDNIPVVSTAGFPNRGTLTATTTTNQNVTINYQGSTATQFLTNNGGSIPGTLAAGTTVTGSAASPATYQNLMLVKAGPTTTGISLSPNPNNGFDAAAGNLGLFDSFNVTATASSAWANINLAEAFVAPTSRPRGTAAPVLRRCTVPPTPRPGAWCSDKVRRWHQPTACGVTPSPRA